MYIETKLTGGVVVVDRVSADPGLEGVTPVPFDADHAGICKIETTSDPRYKQTLRLIQDCFGKVGDNSNAAVEHSEKITIDVGVDRGLPKGDQNGEFYTSQVVLKYTTDCGRDSAEDSRAIAACPSMEYLDTHAKGGPLPQLDFFYNPFLCQFPNLDVAVVNNTKETIAITHAVFRVRKSRIDRSPVIVFNNRNSEMNFEIQNEGWDVVSDCSLAFNVYPTGMGIQLDPEISHIPTDGPFRHRICLEPFSQKCIVNIADFVAEYGVDVAAIKNARYGSRNLAGVQAYIAGGDPELAQHYACFPLDLDPKVWSPFDDGFAVLSGVMEFDGSDSFGNSKRYALKFRAKVFLFRPKYLAPMPPSSQYNVMFESDGDSYAVFCPVVHRLAAGEADRFNIRIGCEMSSEHVFTLDLMLNGGKQINAGPIRLHHFVPRSWAEQRFDKRTVEESNVSGQPRVNPNVVQKGCLTASIEQTIAYAWAMDEARKKGLVPPLPSEGGNAHDV